MRHGAAQDVRTLREIEQFYNTQIEEMPMNVADHASVEAAFERMPALDVVVNNAGISRDGATDTLSEEDWSAVVDTNLNGVWAVSKFAIQQWRRDGRPGKPAPIDAAPPSERPHFRYRNRRTGKAPLRKLPATAHRRPPPACFDHPKE